MDHVCSRVALAAPTLLHRCFYAFGATLPNATITLTNNSGFQRSVMTGETFDFTQSPWEGEHLCAE